MDTIRSMMSTLAAIVVVGYRVSTNELIRKKMRVRSTNGALKRIIKSQK